MSRRSQRSSGRRFVVPLRCSATATIIYVDLQGKHIKGQPRGRLLTAFKAVAMAWLRLYAGEEDTYQEKLRFIQNHILMNTDKISAEAGVQRFKDFNKLLEWCLSQKHLPDAPQALLEPHTLTEFELYTAVLASQIKHVLAQYNNAHSTTFACELDQLTRLLKRGADAVVTDRNLLNQYKQIASGSGHVPKDDKIPRKKARFADKEQEPGEVQDKKKECARCKKWKPHNKDLHFTNEYRADHQAPRQRR